MCSSTSPKKRPPGKFLGGTSLGVALNFYEAGRAVGRVGWGAPTYPQNAAKLLNIITLSHRKLLQKMVK